MQNQERIWLLQIESLDELNQPFTLRFASGDYIDSSGNYWDKRIKQPALYTNSVYTGNFIKGSSKAGYGEAILTNADRGLDYIVNHSVDGRTCKLFLKDELDVINEVFSGTIQSISFSNTSVQIKLRDLQETLTKQHPYSSYLGNNVLPDGLEGVETDIKGKVKPKVYGIVSNQQPVLVNTAKLIYQSHDNSISPSVDVEVSDVYDRGVMLTKHLHVTDLSTFLTTTVPSSKYITYLGYFRLGAPATGTVTCDCVSTLSAAGDVFGLICNEGAYTLNIADLADLNLSGDIGILVENSVNTTTLLDKICASYGAYWYFEGNEIRVKKIQIPSIADIYVDDSAIINIERTSTGCGTNGIPIYKVNLKYDKVETTQNDLASSVPDAFKARLTSEYREIQVKDNSTKTRHLLSEELDIESCIKDSTAADSSANSILDIVKTRRDFVTCSLRITPELASQIKLSKSINIQSYKLGYSLGKNFLILGYTLDARVSRVQLELFG